MKDYNFASSENGFLPAHIKTFFKHLLVRGFGICLVFISFILFIYLFFYDDLYPSINTVSSIEKEVFFVYDFGINLINFFITFFGFTTFYFLLLFFRWGKVLIKGKFFSPFNLKAASIVFSIFFLSLSLSLLNAGGIVGSVLDSQKVVILAFLSLSQFVILFDILICFSAVYLASYSLDLSFKDIKVGYFKIHKYILIFVYYLDFWVKKLHLKLVEKREYAKKKRAYKLKHFQDEDVRVGFAREIEFKKQQKSKNSSPKVADYIKSKISESKRVKVEKSPPLPFKEENTKFEMPPINLLDDPKKIGNVTDKESLMQNAKLLEGYLEEFGVKGRVVNIKPGPVVTLYEFEPAPGTKTSKVVNLEADIARSMSALSVRIAVVPGRSVIGIELPNIRRETVYLKELLADDKFDHLPNKLNLALGHNIGGDAVYVDLAKMPHLLIAGTTGSGKSVSVNAMILSLLFRMPPDKCRFIMIDPKMLELSIYDGIPHLLAPVVIDAKKAVVALKWAVREMEDRYRNMANLGVRNLDGYNEKVKMLKKAGKKIKKEVTEGFDPKTGKEIKKIKEIEPEELPYIVIIVDEMADLMLVAGKEVEASIQRLAQMARAAGLHLIMATQRPSVDVITGTVKANFPTRISFQVTSKIDSRTILGEQGAEQLLGKGDMLYQASGKRPIRIHAPFVSDSEVEKVTEYLKKQGEPDYVDSVTEETGEEAPTILDVAGITSDSKDSEDEELYRAAVKIVLESKKTSISYVQRQLRIGYNRAAILIERMEADGILSSASNTGRRELLVDN